MPYHAFNIQPLNISRPDSVEVKFVEGGSESRRALSVIQLKLNDNNGQERYTYALW